LFSNLSDRLTCCSFGLFLWIFLFLEIQWILNFPHHKGDDRIGLSFLLVWVVTVLPGLLNQAAGLVLTTPSAPSEIQNLFIFRVVVLLVFFSFQLSRLFVLLGFRKFGFLELQSSLEYPHKKVRMFFFARVVTQRFGSEQTKRYPPNPPAHF
jgi:hypothetical protein